MRIAGAVVGGKRIGRRLGFPTANIAVDAMPTAPDGVYVARVTLPDGRALPCLLNQGRHPTLPEGAPTIEAYILDFDGDLYGQRVEVEYLFKLRDELRFESVDELRLQMARDEEAARAWLREHPCRL